MSNQTEKPAKAGTMFMRIFRLALFLLCPVYIFWSYKMRSGNIMAWPEAERMIFMIVTMLWILGWGFAALAHLRRMRIMMQNRREMAERGEE
ncbi:hypothetical protein LJC48_05215 [Desulfovibrio sp. OttesenSCG-928-C06]|nr:hypothetical protein [Desulfovibrio sp. OttesenSCG-928-C06]